jgi:hypothetical protein
MPLFNPLSITMIQTDPALTATVTTTDATQMTLFSVNIPTSKVVTIRADVFAERTGGTAGNVYVDDISITQA